MRRDLPSGAAVGRWLGVCLVLVAPPSAVRAQDPSHHLDRARSAIATGDLAAAQSALQAYVEAVPDAPDAWVCLGLVRFARQDFDGAAEALERGVELDGTQPGAFKALGRVQTARGDPALAERAFVEAARLDGGDAEPRYLLGRLYQSEGRLVEAERFLEAAVERAPEWARAMAFLGSVRYGLGDARGAEELQRRAVSLTDASDSPEAIPHLELGVLLQRTGRLEESVVQLRRATRIDPSNGGAHFELGRSLHRLGRLPEAAAALQAALDAEPGNPRVHYLLGRVCYEEGDRECGDRHMALSERQRGR